MVLQNYPHTERIPEQTRTSGNYTRMIAISLVVIALAAVFLVYQLVILPQWEMAKLRQTERVLASREAAQSAEAMKFFLVEAEQNHFFAGITQSSGTYTNPRVVPTPKNTTRFGSVAYQMALEKRLPIVYIKTTATWYDATSERFGSRRPATETVYLYAVVRWKMGWQNIQILRKSRPLTP